MSVFTFAYGSNLNVRQLLTRCPSGSFVAPARLYGHRLAFAGYSARWNGAVATVTPDPEAYVPGVIWEITRKDLEILDGYEGHPHAYGRMLLPVVVPSGKRVKAETYYQRRGWLNIPSGRYFYQIFEAYKAFGWDPAPVMRALEHAGYHKPVKDERHADNGAARFLKAGYVLRRKGGKKGA